MFTIGSLLYRSPKRTILNLKVDEEGQINPEDVYLTEDWFASVRSEAVLTDAQETAPLKIRCTALGCYQLEIRDETAFLECLRARQKVGSTKVVDPSCHWIHIASIFFKSREQTFINPDSIPFR